MWRVIGASEQGTSHVQHNLPCQDAFAWKIVNGYLMIAVADGLGSAIKAEQASKAIVEEALHLFSNKQAAFAQQEKEEDQADLLRSIFVEARSLLQQIATIEEASLKDYASTFLVAILHPKGFIAGQIGDGAMVVKKADDSLALVNTPQQGEYINETIPITADNALDALSISSYQGEIQAFAVFSDGLQNLALDMANQAPYEPFFTPLFKIASDVSFDTDYTSAQLAGFLRSERICQRTDDDKTLVLAACVPDISESHI
jgi:serine/threonine protein phosphatase PrpC